MYAKALKYVQENTHKADTYEEFKEILETKTGFIKAPFCGEKACEIRIKEETTASTRCISEEEVHDKNCIYCDRKAKNIVYFGKSY